MPTKASLRVTIDVFSGRPNPVLEFSGDEATELLERLKPGEALEKGAGVPESTLGYRGLIIEQVGTPSKSLPKSFRVANGQLHGPRLAHRPADLTVEEFVCGSTGRPRFPKPEGPPYPPDFPEILRKEIRRFREICIKWPWKPIVFPRPNPCACAPLYEPNWWNQAPRLSRNNCYNYGTNYRTDTFRQIPGGSQPGAHAGAMYTALDCTAVRNAAVADDLIDNPQADNKCPPEGHLAALVIWPGVDFHWYRKGRDGTWSHKPGSTPVTNQDNAGAAIPDPRTANRGGYTQFCTFMTVMHGHVRVK